MVMADGTPMLAYESPPRTGFPVMRFLKHLGAFAGLFLAIYVAMFLLLAIVTPQFRQIFSDFKTTLPSLTGHLMEVSDFYANEWGWLIAAVLVMLATPGVALLTSLLEPESRRRRWAKILALVFILLTLLVSAVSLLALAMPYIRLIQSVSGGDDNGPSS
jgi:hypothetical protein